MWVVLSYHGNRHKQTYRKVWLQFPLACSVIIAIHYTRITMILIYLNNNQEWIPSNIILISKVKHHRYLVYDSLSLFLTLLVIWQVSSASTQHHKKFSFVSCFFCDAFVEPVWWRVAPQQRVILANQVKLKMAAKMETHTYTVFITDRLQLISILLINTVCTKKCTHWTIADNFDKLLCISTIIDFITVRCTCRNTAFNATDDGLYFKI